MHTSWALMSLTAGLISCTVAPGQPLNDHINKRQRTTSAPDYSSGATATASATVTSTTDVPNEINQPFNARLQGQIFPPPIQIEGLSTTDTTDFTINCLDCHLNSDFTLSAGDNDIPGHTFETPEDVEQRGNGTFDFTNTWMAATIDSLNATFEMALNITKSNTKNEIRVPIWSHTNTTNIGILELSATLALELHGWVNSTNDVNFTYGFNLAVPPYSEVILDLTDITESETLGFNETSLTPIPFTASRPDLDVTLELSLRPSITLKAAVDIMVADGSVSAQIGLDVPKLEANIAQVHNVNSTCDPALPSLPRDQVYTNLTQITPTLGFNVFEVLSADASLPGVREGGKQPFNQTYEWPLPTSCLFFDAAKATMEAAPTVVPKSGASVEKAPVVAAILAAGLGVIMIAKK